ncbi:hypothetical protein I5H21_gp054 [Mycobacterium phage Byougenkin]|uniref:DUF732 domain-containing protein n=1 Tax=Mycobacterium phage Byougenkin TaxID=2182394 RepID=A0A2U8UN01_9CAUD|nr:hypothetical protein I5H21_gp054 [Mycobacterium phage Byougenkin]AWN04978.1 hypothetical protein SEA_BYOUGENKIN_54 [Mycobacterium phage Byougenkin]
MRRSEKDWRYWWTMPLLIAAGIIGPGLAAPEAHADINSDAFVMALDSEGIPYTSKNDAIKAGKAVCTILDTGLSMYEASIVVHENTDLSMYDSGYVVGAATAAFCPEHLRETGWVV